MKLIYYLITSHVGGYIIMVARHAIVCRTAVSTFFFCLNMRGKKGRATLKQLQKKQKTNWICSIRIPPFRHFFFKKKG